MARTKTLANMNRDRLIYALVQKGESLREVGDKYGISHTRVAQIVQEQQGALSDEQERAVHAAILDTIVAELMDDMLTAEAEPKISATGKTIEVDGEVVLDKTNLLNVKSTVAKTIVSALESKRRLLATDLPKKKELGKEEAQAAIDAWLADLDEDIRIVKKVKGEVTGEVVIPEPDQE